MLLLTVLWLVLVCARLRTRGLKKSSPPADLAGSVLMLGFFLTRLLRMAAIAYLMAVTLFIRHLSDVPLSAACAPMLAVSGLRHGQMVRGARLVRFPVQP